MSFEENIEDESTDNEVSTLERNDFSEKRKEKMEQ